jgi:hypothetical protein
MGTYVGSFSLPLPTVAAAAAGFAVAAAAAAVGAFAGLTGTFVGAAAGAEVGATAGGLVGTVLFGATVHASRRNWLALAAASVAVSRINMRRVGIDATPSWSATVARREARVKLRSKV